MEFFDDLGLNKPNTCRLKASDVGAGPNVIDHLACAEARRML